LKRITIKKITFRILRFKAGRIDPPTFQDFELNVSEHMTILDCLEKIRLEKVEELVSLAKNNRGVTLCERALNCSRVCPTGVYPARHIADLRRLLNSIYF